MDQHSTSPASSSDLSPGSPRKPVEAAEGASAALPPSRAADAFTISDSGTGVPTRAMEDVLTERWRQIHTFGHTPEKDAAMSVRAMHKIVHKFTHGLMDNVSAGGARSTMRRYAILSAAALLAFIDRLDAEDAANG